MEAFFLGVVATIGVFFAVQFIARLAYNFGRKSALSDRQRRAKRRQSIRRKP